MKLEDATIHIDLIKNLSSELNTEFLIEIHSRYCDSINQILTMIASPLILMAFAIAKTKETHLSIESAVNLRHILNNPPKEPKEAAIQLVDFFQKELQSSKLNVVDKAQKESNELYEKSLEIRNCFENIGLNALVNSWTLFEAYLKEIWVKTLNRNPRLLNNKIINSKNENDSTVNSKTIPLNLLSKYNFDISEHLGEILSVKYDFTGVDGIKKAFIELLDLDKNEISFLEKTSIQQLEICRHIIVHNAGIIDSKYLSRSKRDGEIINHKLHLEITEISDMINCSIDCIREALLLVDRKINNP